ncbi:myosin-7B-like [Halichondria panicea]|uniref:myosin-7B-like n=1 Tax=Halichondria panicea TaxID=6063 RepID=UPI00312B66E3
MKAELSGLHAQLEQLKLQQEKEKAFSMCHKNQIRHDLTKIQAGFLALPHFKVEIIQLLTSTARSLSQLGQECSEACSMQATQAEQAVMSLRSENECIKSKMREQNEKWTLTESNLKQLLREEQHSTLKYEQEVQDLIGKTRHMETALVARDEDIQKMQRKLELFSTEARETTVELTARCNGAGRRVRELETQVNALESSKAAVQATLEKTLHKLKSLEQTRKELQSSMTSCREELTCGHKKMEALQLKHSQELETVRREHRYQLESARKAIKTEHEMTLKETVKTQFSKQQEMRAKLIELTSTLTACELEKTRLVSSLQEQLQKEKDIGDREMTNHLSSVKALELSLLQEKRDRKSLEERASVETHQVRKKLELAEKKRVALEEKLSEAYQEISVLQAIVEKECEERERLTEELSLAKASSKRSKKTY